MGLIRTAILGAIGYLGYRAMTEKKTEKKKDTEFDENGVAFADGQPEGQHRDAGPEAMGDKPKKEWTKTDEELDETFPASDPPANY